jgi:hypothetical protein
MRTKQGGCKQGAKLYHPPAGSSGDKGGELSAWDDDKSIATGTQPFNTSANIRHEKEKGQTSILESATCSPYLIFLLSGSFLYAISASEVTVDS